MPGPELAVVILAAGKGKRMRSDQAKVLHLLNRRPLLVHVLDRVAQLNPHRVLIVVGHQAEAVRESCSGRAVEFVEQTEQLGTGHAVQQTEGALEGFSGVILVLCGDMPLVRTSSLQSLLKKHLESGAKCTVLSLKTTEKRDFGRIVRDAHGAVLRIVEARDATEQEKTIDEYNSGVYCFNKDILFKALGQIDTRNAQGEFYLTDVVEILAREGNTVECFATQDADELLGINSPEDLKRAEQLVQS